MIKRTEALELFKNQQWDKLLPLFPKLDNLLGISQKDFVGVGNVYMHREVMKNSSPVYDIWDNTRCAHTYGPAIHGYEHRAIDLMCNPFSFFLKSGCPIRNPFPDWMVVRAWNVRSFEEDHIGVDPSVTGGSGNTLTLTGYLFDEDAYNVDSVLNISISYYHLKKDSIFVQDGEFIHPGQVCALVGGSGFSAVPRYEDIITEGIGGFHTHVQIGVLGGVAGIDDPFMLPGNILDGSILKSSMIGRCNVNHQIHDNRNGVVSAWLNRTACVDAKTGSKMVYDFEVATDDGEITGVWHDANPLGSFPSIYLPDIVQFQKDKYRWRLEFTHRKKWLVGDRLMGLYRYYVTTRKGRSNNLYISLTGGA